MHKLDSFKTMRKQFRGIIGKCINGVLCDITNCEPNNASLYQWCRSIKKEDIYIDNRTSRVGTITFEGITGYNGYFYTMQFVISAILCFKSEVWIPQKIYVYSVSKDENCSDDKLLPGYIEYVCEDGKFIRAVPC